jgi:hypothetical protein
LALALIDGIADAMEQSLLDAEYTPAELVIEHTPESSIGTRNDAVDHKIEDAVDHKIEDAVGTQQQTTKEEHSQPAIDMNQLAEEYLT